MALLTITGPMGGPGVSGEAPSAFYPPSPLSSQVCSHLPDFSGLKDLKRAQLESSRDTLSPGLRRLPVAECWGMKRRMGRALPASLPVTSSLQNALAPAKTASTVAIPSSLPCSEGLCLHCHPGYMILPTRTAGRGERRTFWHAHVILPISSSS